MIFVFLIGLPFIGFAIYHAVNSFRLQGKARWLNFIGSSLMALGGLGFFGSGVASLGGSQWLPETFEWPVGYADAIIETPDRFIVLHEPSGRIQVYNKSWLFQRGWYVDADGGDFKAHLDSASNIEVWTSRGERRFIYKIDGALLFKGSYSPENYSEFPAEGIAGMVPTSFYLYIFAHPFIAFMVGVSGMFLSIFSERVKKKKSTPA